jgi:hypothetical protein
MKQITTIVLLFILVSSSYSQDILTYKNGKTQKVNILTTNQSDVTCEDFETKEQFILSRTFLLSIKYQEGKKEPFGVELPKNQKKTQLSDSLKKLQSKVLYSDPYSDGAVYLGFHGISYLNSLNNDIGSKAIATTSNGILIGNQFYLGGLVGLGLDFKEKNLLFPIALDAKFKLGKDQDEPILWLGGQAGVFFKDETEFFYHPNLTLMKKQKKGGGAITFGIGFLVQQTKVFIFNGRSSSIDNVSANHFTFSIGGSF